MNIQECKEIVSELINDKYKKDLVLKQITTQEIEQNGFLLKEHADAISESAKYHSLIVVFRQTGKDSLDRIRQGNPCKGHALLSKTVKIKNEKKTYKCKDDIFNKVKGLVGYGHDENGELILDGLYAYENNKIVQKKIDKVSLNNSEEMKKFFTGDYDMEDLFTTFNGITQRALAATPEEKSAINYMNNSIDRLGKRKNNEISEEDTTLCEYSVIRHGAQSTHISLLLSESGNKELACIIGKAVEAKETLMQYLEGKTVFVDCPLCAVDKNGEWYILNNMNEIVSFYRKNEILQYIPFYYFLKDLKKDNPQKIEEIERYISNLLKDQ